MQKLRLLKLADYLAKVVSRRPPSAFRMSMWGADAPLNPCGFAGCAMGHAAHGKLFKDLTLRKTGQTFDQASGAAVTKYQPVYAGAKDFAAAAKLFNITDTQTTELFGGHNPSDPRRVADKIRRFVRSH